MAEDRNDTDEARREEEQSSNGQQESNDQQDTSGGEARDEGKEQDRQGGEGDGEEEVAEPPQQLSGTQLISRAKELLQETTGRRAESVSGLERQGDGWRVTLEVVELRRIPPTTDVLGTFELDLTADGELAGLRRTRRYFRNQAQGGDRSA